MVTSLHGDWGEVANPLQVEIFNQDESVAFLLRRTGLDDTEAAKTVAELLGGLPLALAQAGAYMARTGTSLSRYAELYQSNHGDLHSGKDLPRAMNTR
jgi:hypothetical protein